MTLAPDNLLNTNEVLKGARTVGGSRIYSSVYPATKPTAVATSNYAVATNDNAVNSIITLTGGTLEVDGRDYVVGSGTTAPASLNLYFVKSLLTAGSKYRLQAVPTYIAPIDQSSAEAQGLNYFVEDGVDSVMKLFIKQSLINDVNQAGGLVELESRVLYGDASPVDRQVYLAFKEAEHNMIDVRYNNATPLQIAGYEFILTQVRDQSNAGGADIVANMTQAEFNKLFSTVEFLPSVKVAYNNTGTTGSEKAQAAYGNTLWKVQSAFGYANATDQANDANRIPLNVRDSFKSVAGAANVAFVNVYYYTFPAYMPRGQQGTEKAIDRHLTKKESAFLGRIDPIYLDYANDGANRLRGRLSRLTNWANPLPLVEFTATSAVTTGASATSTPFFSATNVTLYN